MIFPSLRFVYKDEGEDLPWDGDIQRTTQYGGKWLVRLDGDWSGQVGLLGSGVRLSPTEGGWEAPLKDLTSGTGLVTAILLDASGSQVPDSPSARLFVETGIFTAIEVETLLSEIGALALASVSHLSQNVRVATGEGQGMPAWGYRWRSTLGVSYAATAVLDLWQAVRQNWDALMQRPLKDFLNKVAPVRGRTSRWNGKSVIRAVVDPPNKLTMAMSRVESTDCSENRFLCYVLDVALGQAAQALARMLRSSLAEPMPVYTDMPALGQLSQLHELNRRTGTIARQLNLEFNGQRSLLEAKAEELDECARWARAARKSAFMREITTPSTVPAPTQRLLGTPAYQGILTRFNASRGAILKQLEPVLALLESIERGQVRATWELYEIWCAVQVYAGLIRQGNLTPPPDKPTLFDSLVVRRGMLQLRKNFKFELEGRIEGGDSPRWYQKGAVRQIKVDLWYEREMIGPDQLPKRPDLVVEVTLEKLWQTEPLTFCFDAKYRDYHRQTWRQLLEDICATARGKYQDRFGFHGSFILHTDSNVDYWGEMPLAELPALCSSDRPLDDTFARHRYGSICLKPGPSAIQQVNKIIGLMLRYHADLMSTCLSCGYVLEYGKDIRSTWVPPSDYRINENDQIERVLTRHDKVNSGSGVYCSCPKCARWWVVQHCFDRHDLIIKSHEYQLHRQSRHPEFQGRMMYACPDCGSDPSPEEIRERRVRRARH